MKFEPPTKRQIAFAELTNTACTHSVTTTVAGKRNPAVSTEEKVWQVVVMVRT